MNTLRLSAFPLLSAFLLALAYPKPLVPGGEWLLWIALVPLLWFLFPPQTERGMMQTKFTSRCNPKSAFWGTFFFAFLFIGWNIRWFFAVLPLDWAGIKSPTLGIMLIGAFWASSTFALSLPMGFMGSFAAYLRTRKETLVQTKLLYPLLLFPCLWVLAEYTRAWVFGVLWASPETMIAPYWTFGFLGYGFVHFPALLQTSKLFGLYGAGFFIVLVNVTVFSIIIRSTLPTPHNAQPRDRIADRNSILHIPYFIFQTVGVPLLATIGIFGFLAWYGTLQLKQDENGKTIKRVALVQTDVSAAGVQTSEEFLASVENQVTLLRAVAPKKPDVVVLPESSRLTLQYGEGTALLFDGIFGTRPSVKIVDTAKLNEREPSFQRTYLYETGRGVVAAVDKTFLVPTGEDIPYLFSIPAKILGLNAWIKHFDETRALKRGVRSPIAGLEPWREPEGIAPCIAMAAPSLWRDLIRNEKAEFLINPTSQNIVANSSFSGHAELWLRFFAASTDRWIAEVANSGHSYLIDHRGFLRQKTQTSGYETLVGAVEYRKTQTPYVRFGDWPVLVSALAIGAFFFITQKRTVNS